MDWEPIHKNLSELRTRPNLVDYAFTRTNFDWQAIQREISGLPQGRGLNIAYEAVDRHADGPLADKLAMRWLGKRGEVRDFTYADLKEASNRFANVLRKLGVDKALARAGARDGDDVEIGAFSFTYAED